MKTLPEELDAIWLTGKIDDEPVSQGVMQWAKRMLELIDSGKDGVANHDECGEFDESDLDDARQDARDDLIDDLSPVLKALESGDDREALRILREIAS